MIRTWDGIRKVHQANDGKLDAAKASQFCSELGTYLSTSLVAELRKAIIEGPIHLDGSLEKGDYRGSLVKRVDSYLWKNHGFSFSEKSNHLNDLYCKATREEVAFDLYGRFDPSFNWTPGDFGDGRSCFWLSHAIARYWMKQDSRCQAYCLFQKLERPSAKIRERAYHKSPAQQGDDWYTGYGRCWTFLNWPAEDTILVFNAYPGDNLLNTFVSSIITGLSSFDPDLAGKLVTKKVTFKNSGSDSNWFYTNSGHAIVIGTEASLKKVSQTVDVKEKKPEMTSFQDFAGNCIFGCGRFAWKDRPSIFDVHPDNPKQLFGICEQCVHKRAGQIYVDCSICGESTFYMREHEIYDVCAKTIHRTTGDKGSLIACPACHDDLDLDKYSTRYKRKTGASEAVKRLRDRESFDAKYAADALAHF